MIRNTFLIIMLSLISYSITKNAKVLKAATNPEVSQTDWISLFDGKTLKDWKAADNEASFKVADGKIVVHGPKAHLYYVGEVNNHDFKNFEFQTLVMTTPGSNSGLYFHTVYQAEDW